MKNKTFLIRMDRAEIFNCKNQPKGFTLIELLIAMAVGLIVLSATYAVFTAQNKELNKQEQIVVMQQNARMAMEMMTREIMMAGYGASSLHPPLCSTTCVGITAANADSISFSADLDDSGSTTSGSNENITYDLYTSDGVQVLGRASNGGFHQPAVENIYSSPTKPALAFTYQDANGGPPADLSSIRRIRITVTARTANIDRDLGDYHYYTLESNVTPRNLGMTGY